MTSKQRAYLKSLAMKMDAIIQLGKGGLTPENTKAVDEALAARELIKISVLQNCLEDPKEMAQVLAERTHSQVVQVIGIPITCTTWEWVRSARTCAISLGSSRQF